MVDFGTIQSTLQTALPYVIGLAFGLVLIRLAQRAGKRAGVPGLHTIRDIMTAVWFGFLALGILKVSNLTSDLPAFSFSAILGLTVSLALQTTLSNMISGLLLFRDKALRLHDVISCGGVKGSVVSVGLRNVWIKSTDGGYALISNSALSYGPLINHSAIDRITHKIEQE